MRTEQVLAASPAHLPNPYGTPAVSVLKMCPECNGTAPSHPGDVSNVYLCSEHARPQPIPISQHGAGHQPFTENLRRPMDRKRRPSTASSSSSDIGELTESSPEEGPVKGQRRKGATQAWPLAGVEGLPALHIPPAPSTSSFSPTSATCLRGLSPVRHSYTSPRPLWSHRSRSK
ncbi:uncharacterized protein EI90DRAFT_30618 [Cantharellus anzutake]|uniref:uncharacterized protein n=1 Tax=Cantharellus anzutake TaxID=1750568 RepID=UPI0019071767|nr:uncharacterized protein EI90DRAFT_30618 [Cantharellus anzutake]KAF8343961.1 hypothetical protein EI90DRAFT_30618 [Cantharellus anzutake]